MLLKYYLNGGKYNESKKTFSLHSKDCTYGFGISEMGIPEHIYFGAKTEKVLSKIRSIDRVFAGIFLKFIT